jgi:hypothetical protein
MITFAKKAVLALALGATALASATPAMAGPYGNYRHHRGGDGAGPAIAAGIIGLAIGAILVSASNNNRNRDPYDRRYDPRRDPRAQGQWQGQWQGQYQGQVQPPYRGQPTWQGAQNGDPYDQRYQGGQPGYSRDGYPQADDGYYDRRGYRDPEAYQGQYRDDNRGN